MRGHEHNQTAAPQSGGGIPPLPDEYPVREYVGAMAAELAQMARWNGDEPLARLLDAAAALSHQPLTHPDEDASSVLDRVG